MIKNYDFTLNIKGQNVIPRIECVQGDTNSYKLNISLIDDSRPVVLTEHTVRMVCKKADQTTVFQDFVTDPLNGKISTVLTSQAIAVPGNVVCELKIYGPNSEVLTSTHFGYSVVASLLNEGTVISSNEFSTLTSALAQFTNLGLPTNYKFQPLRGVGLYIKSDDDLTLLTSTKLDQLKSDGINLIWLCFKIDAPTQTGSTITPLVSTTNIETAYNLIKSKGFMVGFKPHVMWGESAAQYTPSDVPTFLANFETIFLQYLALGDWDYISISNELESVTKIENLADWTSLIDSVKAAAPGIPLCCSCTWLELSTNALFSQMDFIGCNFYPEITSGTDYTVDDLEKGLYRGMNDNCYIDDLNELSQKHGKKIIITEVGVGCYADSMDLPSEIGTVYDESAQAKYYQAVLETLGKMENIEGLCWFEALAESQDSFTFLDRPSEVIIQDNWR